MTDMLIADMLSHVGYSIRQEASIVAGVARALQESPHEFMTAVSLLPTPLVSDMPSLESRLIGFTGVGKSGHVARRAAASFSSVGLAAVYVDANEAMHGDLGLLRTCETIIAVSASGRTLETIEAVTKARVYSPSVIGIGHGPSTPLGQLAHVTLSSFCVETDRAGLVPTGSLAMQSTWCNALMIGWLELHDRELGEFKANHPGGTIGGKTSE